MQIVIGLGGFVVFMGGFVLLMILYPQPENQKDIEEWGIRMGNAWYVVILLSLGAAVVGYLNRTTWEQVKPHFDALTDELLANTEKMEWPKA